MKLRIKNWELFQHYKDRCPPWVKLHKSLLDDYDFQCLPLASKALAPMLWLLASETTGGEIEADAKRLAFRLRWSIEDVDAGLTPLIENGFLIDASEALATCEQDATPENRDREQRTETEGEITTPLTPRKKNQSSSFEQFWAAYPKRKSRGQAEKAWAKINPNEQLLADILAALERAKTSVEWHKDDGEFVPYPATWLNAKGWMDEVKASEYSDDERSVFSAYNSLLAELRGWPLAAETPFSADRAASVRNFLGFNDKPDFIEKYFGWIGEHLPAKPGYGIDWIIRKETYLRAREGNFAALARDAA